MYKVISKYKSKLKPVFPFAMLLPKSDRDLLIFLCNPSLILCTHYIWAAVVIEFDIPGVGSEAERPLMLKGTGLSG